MHKEEGADSNTHVQSSSKVDNWVEPTSENLPFSQFSIWSSYRVWVAAPHLVQSGNLRQNVKSR
jgi:hypothetical protein